MQFTIIISTAVEVPNELDRIKFVISQFGGIIEWSHDLDNDDEILRVVSRYDVSGKLIKDLKKSGVSIQLLGIFRETGNASIPIHQKNSHCR